MAEVVGSFKSMDIGARRISTIRLAGCRLRAFSTIVMTFLIQRLIYEQVWQCGTTANSGTDADGVHGPLGANR